MAIFAAWGSFLNVLGYRFISGENIIPRSKCIHCQTTLRWYELIPLISYFFLLGQCRTCHHTISPLYPLIEVGTIASMWLLYESMPMPIGELTENFIAYFIFFSALIVTIRSDFETMLISRLVTLYLIPVGFLFSYFGFLPIDLTTSLLSAVGGFAGFSLFAYLFKKIRGHEGIGEGDIDLIAFIGAFTGPVGIWISVMIGSITGSIFGLGFMLITGQKKSVRIPFGPFLAIGAMIFVIYQRLILQIIL
jgi:leader peptidase (prepilin peptidase)/N-methyltransferase